jgi:hypothetical protein
MPAGLSTSDYAPRTSGVGLVTRSAAAVKPEAGVGVFAHET